MKRIFFCLVAIPLVSINLSGCVPLAVGTAVGVGALGAYAVSKDTIQGDTDKAYESIWDSAASLAKARGSIRQQDQKRGLLDYDENGSKVSIRLIRLTQATVRIRVSARKYSFPNLDLAQDLFTRIIDAAG